ncbi:MAG TPA: OmpA family protein [Pseudomonadales bacterium]
MLLLAALWAGAAYAGSFAFGVDARWATAERDGLCLLEQPIRDFGTVRFVGAPGGAVHLEVLGHRDVFADGAVGLYRVAPPWHPQYPNEALLGRLDQRAGSTLLVGDPLATQVLMALYEGYEAHVQHAARYGGEAEVRIGNTHLRPHYRAFASCLRGVAAAGWASFERTRIEYDSGADGLDEADRTRLRQVAEYVLADPAVTRVYVDGHTDDAGHPLDNAALSKRRAQTVADFLASCGVPRERLVVRWHGAEYPVAAGSDAAARAQNRRTTVRLERNWSDDSAVGAGSAVGAASSRESSAVGAASGREPAGADSGVEGAAS